MYADYESLVLKDYRQKIMDTNFPLNLRQPTPARLKAECLRVCRSRFLKKDEPAILDFFGKGGDQKECLQVIELCKIDKFKPLLNFLNGDTTKTDEKNIFLLAWLIDYSDRPFDPRKDYKTLEREVKVGDGIQTGEAGSPKRPVIQENKPITDSEADDPGFQVEPSTGFKRNVTGLDTGANAVSKKDTPEWKYRELFLVALLLLSGGGAGLFWWWDNRQSNLMSINYPGGCMYWAEDHYQPVPCNQKMPNKRLVALDTALVKNFRKITQPDTITYRAKGWVWYSKINNKVEFFTRDGEHPVIYGRYLKPLTDHMINIHVKQGMTANP